MTDQWLSLVMSHTERLSRSWTDELSSSCSVFPTLLSLSLSVSAVLLYYTVYPTHITSTPRQANQPCGEEVGALEGGEGKKNRDIDRLVENR